MKLEREVRHKSEDIEDEVLLDAIAAIRCRVRIINRDYDIPYIAGYSVDAHTILTPYRDEKDFGLLRRLVRKEKSR